jgi:hypothetical protein
LEEQPAERRGRILLDEDPYREVAVVLLWVSTQGQQ